METNINKYPCVIINNRKEWNYVRKHLESWNYIYIPILLFLYILNVY